ncbi:MULTISPECIES: glycosyltransferase family 4 protein [Flavobacteriaceae]|uniref:Glycosyltransferase n=2 Tax=Flavobacteriaceae TaxID=49546 RepID=A0A4Y8AWX1_9FLAO|nr:MULTISPECIES: glycosyltransferase family 1 protein [Flavobacteriaceae]TEW77020.1 glycosyltransferase [Gramella jeungdoensis]GGK60698.1 glycosyl transferase [Lutibacter litoralis]
MRLGIDASNIGGGGGITHLKEILKALTVTINQFGITELIVFSSQKILNELTDDKIIKKTTFPEFNQGLIQRVKFQLLSYDKEIKKRCDILFSLTGDYIGKFQPVVGMSRNMLLYERNIWHEIKKPKEILRFWLNFKKQQRCFKNASGIIFLSDYARQYSNNVLAINSKQQKIIHHGLSPQFNGDVQLQKEITSYSFNKPFNFLYVSTVHVYKNQWHIVRAISNLRKKGYPVTLTLVGGVIFKPAGELLRKTIEELDPENQFIKNKGHIPYTQISEQYRKASGIIFASNCENMPNILMESMASGVPIVCSNKQPMPEFLKDNGFYFNPKDVVSIENAIITFLSKPKEREVMAQNNLKEIKNYSWDKTAKETFGFLSEVYLNHK